MDKLGQRWSSMVQYALAAARALLLHLLHKLHNVLVLQQMVLAHLQNAVPGWGRMSVCETAVHVLMHASLRLSLYRSLLPTAQSDVKKLFTVQGLRPLPSAAGASQSCPTQAHT